jgi:hypothetical protein
MKLNVLDRFDPKTANGILAAAALASAPDPGVGERPSILRTYEKEASEVLSEIRHLLRIPSDNFSADARGSVSKALADALRDSILRGTNTTEVIARVGQTGQLPPIAYNVIQPKEFANVFYGLGVTRNHIEDAVKHPDDHQHLMTGGMPIDWQDISLFMKRVISRDPSKSHWLLVQTHRLGLDQQVRSACLIYPGDVNIEDAQLPIDVLKAFVAVYGVPLSVGTVKALFVDSETFPIGENVVVDWSGAPPDHFVSFAKTTSATSGLLKVGVAYCIDTGKYRTAVKKRGLKVADAMPVSAVLSETTTSHA